MMAKRPNLLIFMTDQERADVVAPDHPCLTPNAERLAREGLHFTQTYCPTAHCCPSRATFMTGLYPSRHGVFNNVRTRTAIHFGLRRHVITFSELLREAGYDLTLCGKWHISAEEDPKDRGWHERTVTGASGTFHDRSIDDWRRGPQGQDSSGTPRQPGVIQRPGWGDFQLYATLPDAGPLGYENDHDYEVIQAAKETIQQGATQSAPWCLFVGPIGPHDPYRVPEKYVKLYDPTQLPLPKSYTDSLADKPRIYQRQRRQLWDQLSEAEVRESLAHYYAYCTMEDALLGEVLATLDATGQADNTLVIFLSDHGDYCGDHGLYLKGVPAFRQAYHVPCLMRWPNGIRHPGRVVDAFVSLADFAPTFLELGEIQATHRMTGQSLVPFLRDEAPPTWRDAIHTQFNGVELYYTQRSVTTKEFKYVYNGFDFDELYDLRTDPDELNNVAERSDYQAIKQGLVRKMWHFAAEEEDIIFNPYATVGLAPWGPADGLSNE
ncbi:MAG: sulfatase-like hydrolase/transferase [Caldilineaceae bacterium]|nr:sulfatase-like hydrolase/transferase [Caldilineaceae bacterium]